MTDGAEAKRQRPDNFDARFAGLNNLYHDPSRQDKYRAELELYEKAEKGEFPDDLDLDLALWDPEDYKKLRERHQQSIQGESL